MERYIERIFGDKAKMNYYDAALPQVQEQFADFLQAASNRYWPHPLVLVNDRVVMAGDVDAHRLSGWIEKALEE